MHQIHQFPSEYIVLRLPGIAALDILDVLNAVPEIAEIRRIMCSLKTAVPWNCLRRNDLPPWVTFQVLDHPSPLHDQQFQISVIDAVPAAWQEEIQRRVDERIAAEGEAAEQDISAEEALDIILGGAI